MKDTKKLSSNNKRFGETQYDPLTQEIKERTSPILILMAMKMNVYLKQRGFANDRFQRPCADKDDCYSPLLDFYSFKHECEKIVKESRDFTTADLSIFSYRLKEMKNNYSC